ncbi:hypothetical protein BFP70_01315 [Thioclava sp. SK-1]|uniref:helix-turn-helix domain-containing protein n=1 Tax=Thioclava sp. SK-1 TaxID=1889770 RepID=UPI000824D745|nr:helix-turn-helix domain-containing protein [Thioclava sp. SK-1]OCX64184.1 hypothetical protein BFP70_01315 [Thioclava sp. SK-1]
MTAQTLNRFEWLKAVNRADLLPRCTKVAAALAVEFYNDKTGRLDPGVNTLADATGQTVDTVKRAIRDLTEGGWLARTEGRGRGNKTEYTLLSPGKVIAISSTRKGAPVHQTKGGRDAPLTKEKGAPVRGKGGTGALSYNDAKQTLNKGGANPDRFRHHQFTGNAWTGPAVVPATEHAALAEWGRWLKAEGFPALSEFPIKGQGSKKGGEFFAFPWKRPPTDMERADEARAYFSAMIEPEGLRYAAQ